MKAGVACALAALATLAWSLAPAPVWAQTATPSEAADRDEQPLADVAGPEAKAAWQGRYRTLIDQVAGALTRYEIARARYSKNRQRNTARGQARKQINDQLRQAEIERADAEAELAEFPEIARRAGVPPGWLREVEDSAPATQVVEATGS